MSADLSGRDKTAFVTMMNLLRKRSGLSNDLFYSYWRDAHAQIASRLPGLYQYFTHHLDYEQGRLWPRADGVDHDLEEPKRWHGDAEMSFLSSDDFSTYLGSIAPLMNDEQNLFGEAISYLAAGDAAHTWWDELADPSPNGDQTVLKFLVYLRCATGVDSRRFREHVEELARALAATGHVARVRTRVVGAYDNSAVKLEAPNVSNYKAEEDQYQAGLEVAFHSPIELARLASSWPAVAGDHARYVQASHAYRILRTYTYWNHGRVTLAGLRTPTVADQIRRVGAVTQLDDDVVELLSREHVGR
jgi:EthD domain